MKTLLSCGFLLLVGFASAAAAACENPTPVAMPDGNTASEDQLLQAQAQVRAYMAAMEEYLTCLNDELETAGDEAPADFKSLMVTRYNEAVGEMETVAQAFNEEVQAYRAANPPQN